MKSTSKIFVFLGVFLTLILLVAIPLITIKNTTLIWFIIPIFVFWLTGVSLYTYIFKNMVNTQLLLFGLILGICINLFAIALTNYFFANWVFKKAYIILLINILFSMIILYFLRFKIKSFLFNLFSTFNKSSTFGYLCIIIFLTLLLICSFSVFGKITQYGYMYKDLHATDLLHHMTLISELKKEVPPYNVYFSGEILHYYWLSHLLPAFIYSLNANASLKELILLSTYFYALLFTCILILFLKQYFKDNKIIFLLLFISLLMYSYNDLFVLIKWLTLHLPKNLIDFLNLKYFIVDEWGQEYTNYSHGWFRAFMVEPQCSLSLSIVLLLIIIANKYSFLPKSRSIVGLQAFLLGINLAVDAFIGLVFGVAYAIAVIYELFFAKKAKQCFISLCTMILIGGFIVFCLFILQIFEFGKSYLTIQPYSKMIIMSIPYFIIDYGPMFVFGVFGIIYVVSRKISSQSSVRFLTVLLVISLFFMFFVNIEGIGSTQMIRKAGKIFRIPLLIFSGVFLSNVLFKSNIVSKRNAAVVGILTLIALPTPFIDVYTINNTKGVAKEYFVSSAEMEAYQWIKENTEENAIVQDLPGALTPLAAFAERRTALGDWEHARCYGIGVQRVSERHKEIYRELFGSKSTDKKVKIIKKYNINYIVIDQKTVKKFPNVIKKFDKFPQYFSKVYCQAGVTIYKCW